MLATVLSWVPASPGQSWNLLLLSTPHTHTQKLFTGVAKAKILYYRMEKLSAPGERPVPQGKDQLPQGAWLQ